jgi:chromosome segregation ATPase
MALTSLLEYLKRFREQSSKSKNVIFTPKDVVALITVIESLNQKVDDLESRISDLNSKSKKLEKVNKELQSEVEGVAKSVEEVSESVPTKKEITDQITIQVKKLDDFNSTPKLRKGTLPKDNKK